MSFDRFGALADGVFMDDNDLIIVSLEIERRAIIWVVHVLD